MKKFEYLQVEYSSYPTPEDLNKEGEEGWELVCIYQFKKRFFDTVLESYYEREIFKATFKREI